MRYKTIRVTLTVLAGILLAFAMVTASTGTANAWPPSTEWCDSQQRLAYNDCRERYNSDSSLVIKCFRVVDQWHEKCLRGEIEETYPCLCNLLELPVIRPEIFTTTTAEE